MRNYQYSARASQLAVTSADKPGNSGSADAAITVQNSSGLIDSNSDFLGITTQTTWDTTRRLPLQTTQATGRAEAQTVQTQWHPSLRLPVLITEAGATAGAGVRTTAYTYDASGNPLTETLTDTTTAQSRTWAYTYNPQGLVATVADPRSAAAGKSWQFT